MSIFPGILMLKVFSASRMSPVPLTVAFRSSPNFVCVSSLLIQVGEFGAAIFPKPSSAGDPARQHIR